MPLIFKDFFIITWHYFLTHCHKYRKIYSSAPYKLKIASWAHSGVSHQHVLSLYVTWPVNYTPEQDFTLLHCSHQSRLELPQYVITHAINNFL